MRRTAVTLAVAVGVTAIALKLLPIPFLWIALTWSVAAFVLAGRAPRLLKQPLVIVGSLPLALAVGEGFLAAVGPPEIDPQTTPYHNQSDTLLGWKPKPSLVARATETVGGQPIYDVKYSTDATGHRVPPPDRGAGVEGCVLVFADSFSFGEGVNDQETYAYQLGLKTGGRFKIVNMATGGYGAEHMLASIERGELATHPACTPTHIFYLALPVHVPRAAGKTKISVYGPRYRLGPSGVPEYVGTTPYEFGSKPAGPRGWRGRLSEQLQKSRVYAAFKERQTSESDIQLYFAIVKEAYRRFAERWPKAKLHIIGWDLYEHYANGRARFHAGLDALGIKTHYIDDIIPGYTRDRLTYGLHKFDLHPNPLAHERVAAYLAERVLPPVQQATKP